MKDLKIENALRNWARSMVSRYTWLTIQFEYSEKERVYLVSYSPEEKAGDDFVIESIALENRMKELYGDYAPLFCYDEELFRLSPAAEVIRYEPKRMPAPSQKRTRTMTKTTRTRKKKPQPLAVEV